MEKDDIQEIVQAMKDVFPTAEMVQVGFKEMHERFDRIENIIMQDHTHRIQLLEEKMKRMEDALAV